MFACGQNDCGQLGLRSTTNRRSLWQFDPLPSGEAVVQVACGQHHTIVLTQGGALYACGYNVFGQLGLKFDYLSWVQSAWDFDSLFSASLACNFDALFSFGSA